MEDGLTPSLLPSIFTIACVVALGYCRCGHDQRLQEGDVLEAITQEQVDDLGANFDEYIKVR